MAKLRTCIMCGTKYEYCSHCPSKNVLEPWRNLYCSENCRDAFTVFGDYKLKRLTALEAKDKLVGYKVTPARVKELYKPIVEDIFNEATPKVVEEVVVSEDKKETEENDKSVFQRNFKKKRRFEEKKKLVNEDSK